MDNIKLNAFGELELGYPLSLLRTTGSFTIESSREGIRVISNVRTNKDVILAYIDSGVISEPTYQTVQIGIKTHILEPTLLAMNHSCDPNIYIDTKNMVLTTIKEISQGDELTFFYPSTEFSMSNPFLCSCGYEKCLGHISGALGIRAEAATAVYKYNEYLNILDSNAKLLPLNEAMVQ